MLKNNKNGPTKTNIKAPAHKPLADPLLSALGKQSDFPYTLFSSSPYALRTAYCCRSLTCAIRTFSYVKISLPFFPHLWQFFSWRARFQPFACFAVAGLRRVSPYIHSSEEGSEQHFAQSVPMGLPMRTTHCALTSIHLLLVSRAKIVNVSGFILTQPKARIPI
jgi:hypothetical protein